MAKLIPALLVALLVPLLVSGKRKAPAMLRFHLEASEDDGLKKTTRVVMGTKTYRVLKSQKFDQRDLDGFYPFEADSGASFGAAFRLGDRAAKDLSKLTENARGRRLFTVINTDVIGFVVIDGPIEDGYILCWKGLTRKHIELIQKSGIPRIEPENPPLAPATTPATAPAPSPRSPAGPGEPALPSR